MTDKLPPNLLALFAPRPPLRFLEAPDYPPQERKTQPISGVAQYLPALQVYKETDVYEPTESWLQMKDRKKRERKEQLEKLLTEGPKNCENCRRCMWKVLADKFALQTNPTRIRISVVTRSRH